MAWKSDDSTQTNPRFPRNVYDKEIRILSATETEKCLGFPSDWTRSEDSDIDTHSGCNRRRNAVGNAFAVPVIARILIALCTCLEAPRVSAMSLWLDPTLPVPYYPDVLDDLFPKALELASEYSDLTSEFDSYICPEWANNLLGPDPGAKGHHLTT